MPTATSDGEEPALTAAGIGLRELEAFLAVAELSSFSLAAKRMHLSQPAVTARVQKLEAIIGMKLLHRTTRSVETTEAGRRLAEQATRALRDLRILIGELMGDGAGGRRVVVAATPMIAAALLPRPIQRYREQHPKDQVTVVDLRYDDAIEMLLRGECDLGIMALDDPQPGLRFQSLVSFDLVVVAPASHPLAAQETVKISELVQHSVMLLDQYAHFQSEIQAECRRLGLSFEPSVKAGNLPTLLGMLDAGAGVTVLPHLMAQYNATRARSVIPFEGLRMKRRYGILFPKDHKVSAAARRFAEFLQTDFAAEPPQPISPSDKSIRTPE